MGYLIAFGVGMVVGGIGGCIVAAFVFYKVANFINQRIKF